MDTQTSGSRLAIALSAFALIGSIVAIAIAVSLSGQTATSGAATFVGSQLEVGDGGGDSKEGGDTISDAPSDGGGNGVEYPVVEQPAEERSGTTVEGPGSSINNFDAPAQQAPSSSTTSPSGSSPSGTDAVSGQETVGVEKVETDETSTPQSALSVGSIAAGSVLPGLSLTEEEFNSIDSIRLVAGASPRVTVTNNGTDQVATGDLTQVVINLELAGAKEVSLGMNALNQITITSEGPADATVRATAIVNSGEIVFDPGRGVLLYFTIATENDSATELQLLPGEIMKEALETDKIVDSFNPEMTLGSTPAGAVYTASGVDRTRFLGLIPWDATVEIKANAATGKIDATNVWYLENGFTKAFFAGEQTLTPASKDVTIDSITKTGQLHKNNDKSDASGLFTINYRASSSKPVTLAIGELTISDSYNPVVYTPLQQSFVSGGLSCTAVNGQLTCSNPIPLDFYQNPANGTYEWSGEVSFSLTLLDASVQQTSDTACFSARHTTECTSLIQRIAPTFDFVFNVPKTASNPSQTAVYYNVVIDAEVHGLIPPGFIVLEDDYDETIFEPDLNSIFQPSDLNCSIVSSVGGNKLLRCSNKSYFDANSRDNKYVHNFGIYFNRVDSSTSPQTIVNTACVSGENGRGKTCGQATVILPANASPVGN